MAKTKLVAFSPQNQIQGVKLMMKMVQQNFNNWLVAI